MSLLREARDKKGLTQAEVAKRANLSVSYLSRLESGERRLIDIAIARLAHAIGCDPRDLIPKLPEDKTSMTATEEVIHV